MDAANLAWPAATTSAVLIRYRVKRFVGGAYHVQTGHLYLAIRAAAAAECIVTDLDGTTTIVPGVAFYGAVAAGVATLQYTTTALGAVASLAWTVEEVYP